MTIRREFIVVNLQRIDELVESCLSLDLDPKREGQLVRNLEAIRRNTEAIRAELRRLIPRT